MCPCLLGFFVSNLLCFNHFPACLYTIGRDIADGTCKATMSGTYGGGRVREGIMEYNRQVDALYNMMPCPQCCTAITVRMVFSQFFCFVLVYILYVAYQISLNLLNFLPVRKLRGATR